MIGNQRPGWERYEDVSKVFMAEELKAEGEKLYTPNCVACHQANGKGIPGTFDALAGSKIANGPKAGHVDIVMNGKTGTARAAFKHLADVQITAVVTYERNAWGNAAGPQATWCSHRKSTSSENSIKEDTMAPYAATLRSRTRLR